MHGALRSRRGFTLSLEQRQPSGAAGALPTTTSPTVSISVTDCCRSKTPTSRFGRRTTVPCPTSGTSSRTTLPPTSTPSVRALPVVAVVTITIGAASLAFAGIFLLFAYRRRAAKRQTAARMYISEEYQAMTAMASNTQSYPPGSPSALSSLSARVLLDLGFQGAEDGGYPYGTQEPQPRAQTRLAVRESIDTLFALRFYYTHKLDRRSRGSLLAELPATPPLPSVPSPLPTQAQPQRPASSTTAAAGAAAAAAGASETRPKTSSIPKRAASSHKRKPSIARRKGRIYLNPAGEPWVSVPPPTAPLPPTPEGQVAAPEPSSIPPILTPPQQSASRFPKSPPKFSLFPPAAKKPQQQQQQQRDSRNEKPSPRPDRQRPGHASAPPTTAMRGPLRSNPVAVGEATDTSATPPPAAGLGIISGPAGIQMPEFAPPPTAEGGTGMRRSLPSRLWGWGSSGLGGWRSPRLGT